MQTSGVWKITYGKYNFSMTPHARLLVAGRSVCHNFLKGQEVKHTSYLKTFYSSKSVKVGYFPLVEELAKKGHKVIIVTPFKGIHLLENISI